MPIPPPPRPPPTATWWTGSTASTTFKVTQDETNLQAVLGLDTSVPQVKSSLKKMDSAVEGLADARGQLGAKMNRLEQASQRRDDLKVELETLQSEQGDADILQAYSELTQRQQNGKNDDCRL